MVLIPRRSAEVSLATSILALSLIAFPAIAETWTVNGGGGADFLDIQSAISAASQGDTIIVAPGIYTGVGSEVVDMLGKAVTLQASGTAAETIIDGESLRRGIMCSDGETATTIIDGFTIRHCSITLDHGGGMRCVTASPTVTGCVFTLNSTDVNGGGVSMENQSHPTFIDCEFNANSANSNGSGVYCSSSSQPLFIACDIIDNDPASIGGGIAATSSSKPFFSDCRVTGNSATSEGYGGGGVYSDTNAHITFSECVIADNEAPGYGAGVIAFASDITLTDCDITGNTNIFGDAAGGIQLNMESVAIIRGCLIAENSGGGIGFDDSSGHISRTWVQDNVMAGGKGGGIRCDNGSSPTITDCTIWRNSSDSAFDRSVGGGGGLACLDESSPAVSRCVISENIAGWEAGVFGGGVYADSSSPTFVDCVLNSNTATGAGGAVYLEDGNASFFNSTMSFNTSPYGGAIFNDDFSMLLVESCDLSSNVAAVSGGGMYAKKNGAAVCINATIAWNDAPEGGGLLSDDGGASLLESTVWCNTSDQTHGDWNDLGGVLIAETCPLDCPDITLDGSVGVEDLMAVLTDWGEATSSDVDASGVVDMIDLLAVIEAWGTCS